MKIFTLILMLHVCAAIDWALTYKEFYCKHAKLAKLMEKAGLIWTIQSIINVLILIIVALATFDGDELRMALYRLTLSERGKDEEFDMKVDSIVAFKDATKTPGEPAWVTRLCFGGMTATLAIWLLTLIH